MATDALVMSFGKSVSGHAKKSWATEIVPGHAKKGWATEIVNSRSSVCICKKKCQVLSLRYI
jgi:hypothetical protein